MNLWATFKQMKMTMMKKRMPIIKKNRLTLNLNKHFNRRKKSLNLGEVLGT